MSDQIQSTMRRARAYWYVDGFVDLMVGALFVLIALVLYGQQAASGVLVAVSSLLFPVVVIGGMFASRALVKFLKNRYTFPQRGYVEYRQPGKLRSVISGLAGLVIAVFLMWLILSDQGSRVAAWLPVIQGAFVSAILALVAYQAGGINRFYAIAAFAFLLGMIQKAVWGVHPSGSVFFYALLGVAFLLTGGFTLRRFLHELPPMEEGS